MRTEDHKSIFERAQAYVASRADSPAYVANQPVTSRFRSAGLPAISQWFDLMTARDAFGSNPKLVASCQARLSSATTKRVGAITLLILSEWSLPAAAQIAISVSREMRARSIPSAPRARPRSNARIRSSFQLTYWGKLRTAFAPASIECHGPN